MSPTLTITKGSDDALVATLAGEGASVGLSRTTEGCGASLQEPCFVFKGAAGTTNISFSAPDCDTSKADFGFVRCPVAGYPAIEIVAKDGGTVAVGIGSAGKTPSDACPTVPVTADFYGVGNAVLWNGCHVRQTVKCEPGSTVTGGVNPGDAITGTCWNVKPQQ